MTNISQKHRWGCKYKYVREIPKAQNKEEAARVLICHWNFSCL